MSNRIDTTFSRRGRACAQLLAQCPDGTFNDPDDDDTSIVVTVSRDDIATHFLSAEHSSYAQARTAIEDARAGASKSIIVTLSSWGSFDPLRISLGDLQDLVIDEAIETAFASVIASFGELPRHSEQGLNCCSHTLEEDGSYVVSYLFRFPEQDKQKNWKVRQVGVYHRYLSTDQTHFWILLQSHPKEEDALARSLDQGFSTAEGRDIFNKNPFRLHELLFNTYIHDWRWFMNTLGLEYGRQSSIISTARTSSAIAFGLTLKTLQDCKKLLEKILALPAIFEASLEIMDALKSIEHHMNMRNGNASVQLHRPMVTGFQRSSQVLVNQTQGIVDLLGNTLDLKNQEDAGKVNGHLLGLTVRTAKDSETIRVITVVTAFYLPATSLATLFGMNFFNFDETSRRIVLSSDIWIFAVIFAGLTGLTIFLWWAWLRISTKTRSSSSSIEMQERGS